MAYKIAKFEYKCRRCGQIDMSGSTAKENGLPVLSEIVAGTNDFRKKLMGPPIRETVLHNCTDGGMGIADLTGYSVKIEG